MRATAKQPAGGVKRPLSPARFPGQRTAFPPLPLAFVPPGRCLQPPSLSGTAPCWPVRSFLPTPSRYTSQSVRSDFAVSKGKAATKIPSRSPQGSGQLLLQTHSTDTRGDKHRPLKLLEQQSYGRKRPTLPWEVEATVIAGIDKGDPSGCDLKGIFNYMSG